MNKRAYLLSLVTITACSTLVVSLVSMNRGSDMFSRTTGTDDFYSITVEDTDITTETENPVSGSFVAKTDQLQNDVSFAYVNARYSEGDDAVYIDQNEVGYICNPYEAGGENEIRSMNSITITGYGTFYIKWGFENAGVIEYVGIKQLTINPSYEYDFEGDHPNYVLVTSGNAYSAPYIKQFVIKYGNACESGTNPYKVVDGIKYRKLEDHAVVLGLDNHSLENAVIAKQVDGLDVTAINDYAFEDEDSLLSVTIPNTISEMRDAFYDCDNIATVTFEAGGTGNISMSGAFRGCRALTSLTLPKRACDYQYNFDYYTFYDMENLATIAIEDDYDEGYFTVVDNILYADNGTVLYKYPSKRAGTSFTVPAEVVRLHDSSMRETANLETLILQNTNQLAFDSYALSYSEKLYDIQFNGSGAVKLYWNPLRNFEGHLVLPANTIIDARGLGQLGDGARVFFEATEPLDSWSEDWADSKTMDSQNVKFYFYSENEPAVDAPEHADGFWHRVGSNDAPRVWSDTLTIQSSAEFDVDGAWFAVWAWTQGDNASGAFYYDHNAPVDYKYTINVPTDKNCFIILRMKSGVDAAAITAFPSNEQIHNRTVDFADEALAEVTIASWHDPYHYDNLQVIWK